MVDQGLKGYCAVATAERILSYYGLEADQHVMAQLSKTSALGTSSQLLLKGLREAGPKLGCKVQTIVDLDFNRFKRVSQRYNTEAKKQGLPPCVWTPPTIYLEEFYYSMNPTILRDIRAKEADVKGILQTRVKERIDQGMPLVWSVLVGVVPEVPEIPQARGGHMRIIIGYNPKTDEILYTDSWGAGHELKRMSAADAWTITMELIVITPSALVM